MISIGEGTSSCSPMNVILTGVPGIGKTTVIEKVAASLGPRAGGIITREIRESGRRTGFSIEEIWGEQRLLATRHRKDGPKVGPYRVVVRNLEEIGVRALERALNERDVVIIDEIGKMELISSGVRDMILKTLGSSTPVVATLGVGKHPFLDGIRRRSDVRLVEISRDNRDTVADEVLGLVDKVNSGR